MIAEQPMITNTGPNFPKNILVIDDNHDNLQLIAKVLKGHGFTVRLSPDGLLAINSAHRYPPDLILLDVNMPGMDGFKVCEQLKIDKRTSDIPILFISALGESFNKVKAFKVGGTDYITKPFQIEEVIARINHHLNLAWFKKQLLEKNQDLVEEVEEHKRTKKRIVFLNTKLEKFNSELEKLVQSRQEEMLERLAIVGEKRDDDTGEHTFRVGNLSAEIAEQMGLSEQKIIMLRQAARLHDIGKVAIPDSVLLKPGRLTQEEFEIIKRHTTVGAEILAQSPTPIVRMAEEIALSHHERWDGKGYPQGLSKQQIPLTARIVTVSDVFDALINERPYKKAWELERAITEIKNCIGTQFDPEVVNAFLLILKDSESAKI